MVMLDGYWSINKTYEDRYELTGITDLILEYAKESGKKNFVIMDVGCSIGIAMKYAQVYLNQKGIESFTIGIDYSKNVAEEANKNLDKFINEDMFGISNFSEKADIVICSKMAIFVPGELRYKIIKKCTEFLKKEGILITDVDCFEKQKLSEELKLIQYVIPTPSCFKNGFRGFPKEFRRRTHTRFRLKMKKCIKLTHQLTQKRFYLLGMLTPISKNWTGNLLYLQLGLVLVR